MGYIFCGFNTKRNNKHLPISPMNLLMEEKEEEEEMAWVKRHLQLSTQIATPNAAMLLTN